MENIGPIIISCIAGFATVLGNIFLFIPVKYKDKVLSFTFGLSFAVMFLISVGELIPEGLKMVMSSYNVIVVFVFSMMMLIGGHFFVRVCDNIFRDEDELYRVGLLCMLSILIHNIPEGIICALTSSVNIRLGLKMSLAILIHNIPEGICICLPVYYATKSKAKAFWLSVVSGAGEVIGAIITMLFLERFISNYLLYAVFLGTAGIMISLSINKIFRQGIKLGKYKYFGLGIITGIFIIVLTL